MPKPILDLDAPEDLRPNDVVPTTKTIYLSPQDIAFEGTTAVRPLPDIDDPKVVELAESIARNGQIEAITVRPAILDAGNYPYRLVAGGGRLQACRRIGQMIRAEVHYLDDDHARWIAFDENYRRRDFTPVELARLFLAERNQTAVGGRVPPDWSVAVSSRFHVSRATVTQHVNMLERLSDSPELLDAVHSGRLSMDAALDLAKSQGEERERVRAAAEAAAKAEAERKAAAKAAKTAKKPATAGRKPAKAASASSGSGNGTPQGAAVDPVASPSPAPVLGRHVRQARRETGAAAGSRRLPELLEDLCGLVRPGYPAPMNAFLSFFCGEYAKGKGTKAGLEQRWRNIAAGVWEIGEKNPAQPVKAKAKAAKKTAKKTAKKRTTTSKSKPSR